MSAIGAIFHRDRRPSSIEDIARMEAILRVHGPRRHQHRRFDNFSMCWTHLEDFTPEDRHDHQPLVQGDTAICFAGRLHFRADLAGALGIEPDRASAIADSALAAAAWSKWGKASLDRLEGVFAIIIVDRARQSLFAARTPYAAPPLVYHERPDRFAIASAPKGLFALHDIPKEVDDQRIADALVLNNQDLERGFFKGIGNLPAGHWLEVTEGKLTIARYYDLEALAPVRFASDSDYVEAANEIFSGCVEDATRASVAPTYMVSSGLDSSSVVVAAIEGMRAGRIAHRPPVLGFTHVPEDGWDGRTVGAGRAGDESAPVRALAAAYPELEIEFVDSPGFSIDEGLDDIIRIAEIPPFGWNNNYWTVAINRRAQALGRNVMLGGQSGNRTLSFSNRLIFPELLKQGRLRELHRHLVGYRPDQSLIRKYWGLAARPLLPSSLLKKWARYRGHFSKTGWHGYSAIHPDYARDMQVDERMKEFGWDDGFNLKSPQEQLYQMVFGGTREMGSHVVQAYQSVFKIESRDPLGYRRLSEFCASIPKEQYMSAGRDRWLIKRMMKGRLPKEILTAPRGRQAADWHLRMTRDLERYRAEIDRIADDPDLAKRFDVERMRKVIETWPAQTPLSLEDHPELGIAMLGMGRSISASRFIKFALGKN